jgi:hypothetical protein
LLPSRAAVTPDQSPDRSAPLAAEPVERRHTPAAARGPYFGAVREAWQVAGRAGNAHHPALALAIAAYARDGHARGVPVQTLLRALDTVVRPERGGEAALDFGRAREVAGTLLIRSYFRAD